MRLTSLITLIALLLLNRLSYAQTNAPSAAHAPETTTQLQAALDQLTQSNRDLLDLLKKQQAVLEDMQFDRRLQSRQIQSLEERLSEAQLQNVQLQNKVDNLEAQAGARSATPSSATPGPAPNANPSAPTNSVAEPPSSPPSTYLPPADSEDVPGTKSWHRLFTLKGDGNKQTDLFPIRGRLWRVLWHNQDKDGKTYQNTSALFINAFPKDDTVPQQVCSKLGTGGDSSELQGPGNYYLKIEASGGSWELAVEDFH